VLTPKKKLSGRAYYLADNVNSPLHILRLDEATEKELENSHTIRLNQTFDHQALVALLTLFKYFFKQSGKKGHEEKKF